MDLKCVLYTYNALNEGRKQTMSKAALLNKDCKEAIRELIDLGCKVDAIIADIPYNINQAEWDQEFSLNDIVLDLHTILKPGGNLIIFNGWSHVTETKQILDTYFTLRNWIIYDRVKGRGAKTNFVSTREDILWYTKGEREQYTFNRTMSNIPKKTGGMGTKNGEANRVLSNVWSDISPIVPWSPERVDHPTQKPLQLMERCIKIWTNPGDMVLDFTMGSGSTGVACKNLNRDFIGIEINKYYFDIAQNRIFGGS